MSSKLRLRAEQGVCWQSVVRNGAIYIGNHGIAGFNHEALGPIVPFGQHSAPREVVNDHSWGVVGLGGEELARESVSDRYLHVDGLGSRLNGDRPSRRSEALYAFGVNDVR